VIYTPTFVLAEDNREIRRREGLVSDDFFWTMLDRLIARLPAPAGANAP
jgi:hypothetical protein